MDILIQLGIYVAIGAVILIVCVGGIYLKKKFNVKDEDLVSAEKVINLLALLATKTDFKYSGDVGLIVKYIVKAIDIADKYENISDSERKILIENEALQICADNGIKQDLELINAVNDIIDLFVK